MNAKPIVFGVLIALMSAIAAPAHCAPQDQLAECLVTHTSTPDRALLIRWIFMQLALAPDVEPFARIPTQQREATNKETADLITRLITVDCPTELRYAYDAEGGAAIEGAFQVVGATAMRQIMRDPKVMAGMVSYTKYLDKAKVKAAFQNAAQDQASHADTHH